MSTTPLTASLIDLAARRQLPLHQHMDHATIAWISENRPDLPPAPAPVLRRHSKELLAHGGLPTRWWADPRLYTSLHGVRHAMRTAAFAAVLAEADGLDDADTATTIVAAAVHDCQRRNDKDDHGHGARAAIWLAANADTVWGHFGLTATPRGSFRRPPPFACTTSRTRRSPRTTGPTTPGPSASPTWSRPLMPWTATAFRS